MEFSSADSSRHKLISTVEEYIDSMEIDLSDKEGLKDFIAWWPSDCQMREAVSIKNQLDKIDNK